jgi:hypothetical protein
MPCGQTGDATAVFGPRPITLIRAKAPTISAADGNLVNAARLHRRAHNAALAHSM